MAGNSLTNYGICIFTIFLMLHLSSAASASEEEEWTRRRPRYRAPKAYNNKNAYVVGGDRDKGSAYRYRNGYDKTNAKGARTYEHNAGYGFAEEIDNRNPNPALTVWGRKYASAQTSTWGKTVPRVWRVAKDYTNDYERQQQQQQNNNNKKTNVWADNVEETKRVKLDDTDNSPYQNRQQRKTKANNNAWQQLDNENNTKHKQYEVKISHKRRHHRNKQYRQNRKHRNMNELYQRAETNRLHFLDDNAVQAA